MAQPDATGLVPGGRREGPPVVAVVIPAFRAERHIQSVIAGIPEFVRHIVVVDDCSPDETAARVRELDDPRVHLICLGANQGVGGAVLTGYQEALALGADVIAKMDSDGQMDPAFLAPVVAPIVRGDADYTKGNRFLYARELRSMPLLRRLGNAGLSFLTKLASGYWNIFDPANGYTAIAGNVVQLLDRNALDRRYFFESSMLVELGLLRAVVQDVAMPARYGDESSFLSEWRVLHEFPPRLIAALWRRWLIQYFVRDFTAVSLFLVGGTLLSLFGLVWGGYHWILSIRSGMVAPTGTVMLAVLPIILGVQLLLQAIAGDIQNVPARTLQESDLALWRVSGHDSSPPDGRQATPSDGGAEAGRDMTGGELPPGAVVAASRGHTRSERDPALGGPRRRWMQRWLVLLLAIPLLFNALVLSPELRPVPSLNDDAYHYLLIQRASQALAHGQNPLDHWLPETELGFPAFLYYQNLPHLAVVLLNRLLLQRVGLLSLFNLTRYLLMVSLPITVYWSMRRMGFSAVAAVVGAAAAPLLSSRPGYGFEYDSYVWGGLGVYTQLWGMHLTFITLACLHRVATRGTGRVAAVLSCSALVLSHLIYAYMMAITALVLLLVTIGRANARPILTRLALVAGLAALVTAYFWLPLLLSSSYVNVSPYLQRSKYDSFGAGPILGWLVSGDLLDKGRFPALTLLLGAGIISAIVRRTRLATLALALFLVWLALYFGRPTWGALLDVMPLHDALLFHRFIGGVDLGAILLIGLGGEWLWRQAQRLPRGSGAVAAALLVLALAPVLRERWIYYGLNATWMARAERALDGDGDARTMLAALQDLPSGRVYAGLRANWGKTMAFGDLHFTDLLAFHDVVAFAPPYPSSSLNSDLIWDFDERDPAQYDLFDVRYVVAPSGLVMPSILQPISKTARYTLYEAPASGYAELGAVSELRGAGSQAELLAQNRAWLASPAPAAGRFLGYAFLPAGSDPPEAAPGCPSGTIADERVGPQSLDLRVQCPNPSALILKLTYHPNWRVTIDGRQARTFMVSPSFIGVVVPAGQHAVHAEYRPPLWRDALIALGLLTLAGLLLVQLGVAARATAQLAARP